MVCGGDGLGGHGKDNLHGDVRAAGVAQHGLHAAHDGGHHARLRAQHHLRRAGFKSSQLCALLLKCCLEELQTIGGGFAQLLNVAFYVFSSSMALQNSPNDIMGHKEQTLEV